MGAVNGLKAASFIAVPPRCVRYHGRDSRREVSGGWSCRPIAVPGQALIFGIFAWEARSTFLVWGAGGRRAVSPASRAWAGQRSGASAPRFRDSDRHGTYCTAGACMRVGCVCKGSMEACRVALRILAPQCAVCPAWERRTTASRASGRLRLESRQRHSPAARSEPLPMLDLPEDAVPVETQLR